MAWEHGRVRYFIVTTAPTVNDDENDGYRESDVFVDTTADKAYICIDASAGAAVWTEAGVATLLTNIINYAVSPTIVTGGDITDGTNAGTFKVAALTGLLRTTDSSTGELASVSLAEQDNQTITAADTEYIVALNYNGGSPTVSIGTSNPYNSDKRNIPIGRVMKNSSDDVYYISGGFNFQDGVEKLHIRAKSLRGIELSSGSTIAYSGVNNFTMSAGVVFSGVNKFTLASYDSAVTTFIPVYVDGGAGFTEGAARNTIDFAHYDDGDGVLGSVGNNKYGCHWVYRHVDDGSVYVRYGEGSYELAAAEAASEPTTPDHLDNFGLLIGKIIAPQAGGSFTTIQMVSDTFFTGTSVSDHGSLGGLADDDHAQYSLTDGSRQFSGGIDVDGNIVVSGTVDGVDVATATLAGAVITDNQLVRGNGGARGVQESTIVVDDSGRMTNPSQPCFQVNPTSDQSNIAVGSWVTVVLGTEVFDVGSNFASNTFTAPVTGKYTLGVSVYFLSIPADAAHFDISIVTSNRTYYVLRSVEVAIAYKTLVLPVVADMDVNDTAYVQVRQSAGTQQTDIGTSTVFSGALIC